MAIAMWGWEGRRVAILKDVAFRID